MTVDFTGYQAVSIRAPVRGRRYLTGITGESIGFNPRPREGATGTLGASATIDAFQSAPP